MFLEIRTLVLPRILGWDDSPRDWIMFSFLDHDDNNTIITNCCKLQSFGAAAAALLLELLLVMR